MENNNSLIHNHFKERLSEVKANRTRWIIFVSLESIFLLFGLYLLSALSYYVLKRRKRNKALLNNRPLTIRHTLLGLLTFYASTSVLKFALALWVYYTPTPEQSMETKYCVLTGYLYQPVHAIGSTSMFVFLWLRQHSLYNENCLGRLAAPYIMKFSWYILAVIVVTGIAATVGVIVSNEDGVFLYINGTNACSYAVQTGVNAIVVYVGYAVVIVMQGCILFLFIYILRKYQKESKRVFFKTTASRHSRYPCRVRKLLRNCTIAAIVSTSSSFTVVALDIILKGTIAQLVVNAMWDIDNTINLMSVVFCFSNWKKLMLPWPCFNRTKAFANAT